MIENVLFHIMLDEHGEEEDFNVHELKHENPDELEAPMDYCFIGNDGMLYAGVITQIDRNGEGEVNIFWFEED